MMSGIINNVTDLKGKIDERFDLESAEVLLSEAV